MLFLSFRGFSACRQLSAVAGFSLVFCPGWAYGLRLIGEIEDGAQKCPTYSSSVVTPNKCMKQWLCSSKCMKHYETMFLSRKVSGTRFLPPSIPSKWRGLRGLGEPLLRGCRRTHVRAAACSPPPPSVTPFFHTFFHIFVGTFTKNNDFVKIGKNISLEFLMVLHFDLDRQIASNVCVQSATEPQRKTGTPAVEKPCAAALGFRE